MSVRTLEMGMWSHWCGLTHWPNREQMWSNTPTAVHSQQWKVLQLFCLTWFMHTHTHTHITDDQIKAVTPPSCWMSDQMTCIFLIRLVWKLADWNRSSDESRMHFNLSCYTSTDGIARRSRRSPARPQLPLRLRPENNLPWLLIIKQSHEDITMAQTQRSFPQIDEGNSKLQFLRPAESKVSNKPRRNQHWSLLKGQQSSEHRRCWFF